MIKTKFLGDEILKENVHYTCIACRTIDSVCYENGKKYPQVYLEECRYKTKETKMTKFIEVYWLSTTELESKLESESELDSDAEQLYHFYS